MGMREKAVGKEQQQVSNQHVQSVPSSTTPDYVPSARGEPPTLPPKPTGTTDAYTHRMSNHTESPSNSSDIQVSEISSSDEPSPSNSPSSSAGVGSTAVAAECTAESSKRKTSRKVLKESRLSKELAGLQLNTPQSLLTSRRRPPGPPETASPSLAIPAESRRNTRRSLKAADGSGTENEEDVSNRLAPKPEGTQGRSRLLRSTSSAGDLVFQRINSRIRSIETKLARKTSHINREVRKVQSKLARHNSSVARYQVNKKSSPPPVAKSTPKSFHPESVHLPLANTRSLRPRSGLMTPTSNKAPQRTPPSGRKRKLDPPLVVPEVATRGNANVKSPRNATEVTPVMRQPPTVATRSSVARKARLVNLKKRWGCHKQNLAHSSNTKLCDGQPTALISSHLNL